MKHSYTKKKTAQCGEPSRTVFVEATVTVMEESVVAEAREALNRKAWDVCGRLLGPELLAGPSGRQLLPHFVSSKDNEAVEVLLRCRARVNDRVDGASPLEQAVHSGDAGMVMTLLRARARVDRDAVARATWHLAPGCVIEALYSARAAEFARAVLLSMQRRRPRQYDVTRGHLLGLLGYDLTPVAVEAPAGHGGAPEGRAPEGRGQGGPQEGRAQEGRVEEGGTRRGRGAVGIQFGVTVDFVRQTTECLSPFGMSPLQTALRQSMPQAQKLVTALLRCRADVHAPVYAATDERGGLRALTTVVTYVRDQLRTYAPHTGPKPLRRISQLVRYVAACPSCPSSSGSLGSASTTAGAKRVKCTSLLCALEADHVPCVAYFAARRKGPGFCVGGAPRAPLSLAEALTHEEVAEVNAMLRGRRRSVAPRESHESAVTDTVRVLLSAGVLGVHRVVPEQPTPLEAAVRGSRWAAVRVMLEFAAPALAVPVRGQFVPGTQAEQAHGAVSTAHAVPAVPARHRTTATVAHRAVSAAAINADCPAPIRAALQELEGACRSPPCKRKSV